ncbi:ABC transporter permease [Microbacterium paludicola]|uniref:ABC transporter permease n=1 Tax=Microbacterium paludicola TaxID=300019 RepID=UPI0038799397
MSRAASARRMLRSPFTVITLLVSGWAIVAFLVWPNANLLIETFFPDGAFSGSAIERLLSSERALRSLGNSVLLAFALAISTNVVGVFIVLVTRYFRIAGSRILWLGYATTLIYGGIVLAAGYRFVYGDDGIITSLLVGWFPDMDPQWFQGFPAVLMVMTLATTTNHLLFLSPAIAKLDFQMIEAARNLGAGDGTILWRIVLPALRPMLFAVTILSFLTGLGALSAPQVLGGRDFQTIAPMILSFATSATSRDIAALLAVILGLVTIAMLAILTRIERGGTYFSLSKISTPLQRQRIRNPFVNVAVHAVAYVLFAVYLLPVLLIVLYSFADSAAIQTGTLALDRLSLDNYVRVLSQGSALRPFLVSVVYSALAAAIAVLAMLVLTRIIVRHRNAITTALEYLLHIPWILPAAMIALGLIMSYDHPNPLVGGAVLTGTAVILLIAFVIAKIPFTLRLMKAAYLGVNTALEEAAALLGAGTFTIYRRIIVPVVLPTAAAVFALNFNSLLDDYDTAVFLAHPLYQPLGLVIQAAAAGSVDIDARANTFVYTVLLMIITGVTMWLVYGRATRKDRRRRVRRAGPGAETAPVTPVEAGVTSEVVR